MKVVILCGGQGTRLREEIQYRPKPMVPTGGQPMLWHLMKIYVHYGRRKQRRQAQAGMLRKMRRERCGMSLSQHRVGKRLARSGVKVRYNELVEIEKVVAAFHAGRS